MQSRILLSAAVGLTLAACGANDPQQGGGAQPPARAPAAQPVRDVLGVERAAPAATSAAPAAAGGAGGATALAAIDPAIVRLQILLDRSSASPGLIDGRDGSSLRQAIAAFRKAENLGGDGVDAALTQRLAQRFPGAVLTTHQIAPQDVSGPFSPPAEGEDLSAQAENGVNFTTPLEALAERFHVSEALLQALNPGVDFARAGQSIVVPATGPDALPAPVARIVVAKAEGRVRAFAEDGRLLADYPATIGSSERPAPSGRLTVEGVANEPDYTYDPRRVSYDRGDRRVVVPAGPNNPVGTVWIELSRDTYGIHGSPDPSQIGKTSSNGCVRLTNWDAEQLASAVKPGVAVEFV